MAFDFREEALRGLIALREVLDHLIGESFTRHAGGQATVPGSFSVDVFEQDARYILQASLPGVKPEDLVIQAQGNLIAIRGKRQLLGEQADQQWILREHQPSTFFRAITLPGAIDAVAASAHLEFGLLTLELPKVAAVNIIPLSARTETTMATDNASGEQETLESSPAMPADSNADVAADATDTIPDLEALTPALQDTPEIAATDEADSAVASIEAEATSEVAPAIEAEAIGEDEALTSDAAPEATIIAADEADLVATEEALAEAIVAADAAEEAEEAVMAIQEAEAIIEAVQEAALAAELADMTNDEPAVVATVAAELETVEELLIAEESIVATFAETVAEIQAEAAADEDALAETPIAEAAVTEATSSAAEDDAELLAAEVEAAVEEIASVEALNTAEADTSAQDEEVMSTIPEITPEAVAADATDAAEVAAAEALTEATIIAEELVEEILHEVEGELVREIFAEMAEAQREAVADVIAEALLADVLEDTTPAATALNADADAAPLAVPVTQGEVH